MIWNEMKWNELKWNEMKWNEMKWNEMKWSEIDYNTVSKQVVLWARPCGGLWPLDLCRTNPPHPSPPHKSSLHLLLVFSILLPSTSGRCCESKVFVLYWSLLFVVVFSECFRRWVRVLLGTLDMSVSHSWALTWIAMAIVCTCVESDLYVILSGGFSLKDTSWAISTNVRVCKLPVLLITIGMIWT
jgi:hypothetical protein